MINMREVISGVVLKKACSIKADKDSTSSKTINLEVKFDGSTVADVFTKALAGVVIQWQNGPGRKHYTTWKHMQTVKIDFKAPASTQIDPEEAMVQKLKAMSEAERMDYLKNIMAQVTPPVVEDEIEEEEEE